MTRVANWLLHVCPPCNKGEWGQSWLQAAQKKKKIEARYAAMAKKNCMRVPCSGHREGMAV